jgi:hypothetical protein
MLDRGWTDGGSTAELIDKLILGPEPRRHSESHARHHTVEAGDTRGRSQLKHMIALIYCRASVYIGQHSANRPANKLN